MNPSEKARHIDVRYVAELARIELTDEEAERYGDQLEDILEYVDKLQALPVGDTEPTAHAVPRHNVMRQDQKEKSMERTEMLANAPATAEDMFIRVPAVIEDGENG